MMNNFFKITFLGVVLMLYSEVCFSQTFKTITDSINYEFTLGMWHPNKGFTLNMDVEIFKVNPNLNVPKLKLSQDFGSVAGISLGKYGMDLTTTFKLHMESRFIIKDATTGHVEIDYDNSIKYTLPADSSFNKGSWVTLDKDVTKLSTSELRSFFPNIGTVKLDLIYGFGAMLKAELFVYSQTPVLSTPLLPSTSNSGNLLGVWKPDTLTMLGFSSDPINNILSVTHPDGFNIVTKNFSTQYSFGPKNGFEFTIAPPFVETLPQLISDMCIESIGKDEFLTVNLDILDFVGSTVPATKPIVEKLKFDTTLAFKSPVCYITDAINSSLSFLSWVPGFSAVTSTLSSLCNATPKLDIVRIQIDIVDIDLVLKGNLEQEFEFCPEIRSQLDFPTIVEYKKTPTSGSSFSSKIDYDLNLETINFQYPCDYNFLDINRKYYINPSPQSKNFYHELFMSLEPTLTVDIMKPTITFYNLVIVEKKCLIKKSCVDLGWFGKVCIPPFDICIPEIAVPLGDVLNPLVQPINGKALLPLSFPLPVAKFELFKDDWNIYQTDTLNHSNDTIDKGTFRVVPARFIIENITQLDVACHGESTGEFTANILGGTAPYLWIIDNVPEPATTSSTTYTVTGLSAGAHSVKLVDVNGCEVYASVNILEPALPLQFTGWNQIEPSCYALNDGFVKANVTGGTPSYEYNWDNTGFVVEDSIVNTLAGLHNLTIQDSNLCTLDTFLILDQPDSVSVTLDTLVNVFCKGDSTALISVSTFGGTPTYDFLWSNGDTNFAIDSLTEGTYSVTITDDHSCSKDTTFVISEPIKALTIDSFQIDAVNCFNGSDGKIELFVTGGTPGYSYLWYNQISNQLLPDSAILDSLVTGTYAIGLYDALNCMVEDTFDVLQPSLPVSYDSLITDVNCFNGSDGALTVTPNGGTAPYQLNWSTGNQTTGLTNLTTGTYLFTITDNNLCEFEDSLFVNQPIDSVSFNDIVVTHVLCTDDTTGKVWVDVTGGTAPYSYVWSTGDTSTGISSLNAGTYQVTVLDANNCSISESFIVDQPAAPVNVSYTATAVSCFDGNDGKIDVQVVGGTPGYSYLWANSDSIILADTLPNVDQLTTGSYTVLVTDSNYCTVLTTIVINQPQDPLKDSIIVNDVSCFGGNDGGLLVNSYGGTTPYTFQWSNATSLATNSGLLTGWYTVTVTDDKGCIVEDSAFVNHPAEPLSSIVEPSMVNCFGGQDGAALVSVSGGTPPYSLNWNTGDTTFLIENLTLGVYAVTVTDVLGCTSISGTILSQPAVPLNLQISVDSTLCYGDSSGSAQVVISGGTQPYYINWGDGIILFSNTTNNLDNIPKGIYQVRAEDENGCAIDTTFYIEQPDSMTLSFFPTDVTCFDGRDGAVNIQIQGGSPLYDAIWEDGSTGLSRSDLKAGNYQVEVSDDHNCRTSGTSELFQPDPIFTEAFIEELTCKEATDASIEAFARGGTGGFSYQWSNGEVGAKIENLGPGIYQVFSTDISGCKDSIFVTIDESFAPCFDIPNSFSPNGDGINDTWIIDYLNLIDFVDVRVFNQQGVEVFWSNNPEFAWDGNYVNDPLPSATYYYVIKTTDVSTSFTGSLTIIR